MTAPVGWRERSWSEKPERGLSTVVKRIGVLLVGLWLADLAIGLLFRGVYSVVGEQMVTWIPVVTGLGFVIGVVPSVLAAWLIGRWEGLSGLQLAITTLVAFLLGLVAGILFVGPVVTAILTRANPVIIGIEPVVSDYVITALVGLFGAFVGIAVYWAVTLVSERWFHPRADVAA